MNCRYLEALARVDTVLVDKTGTLTFGKPAVTDVIGVDDEQLVVFNILGIGLASVGILTPVMAAAESLPDVAVFLNSSRLLRAPEQN